MRFRLPNIDDFSFWLGFILATVFWWIIALIRPALQQAAENARAQRTEKKEKAKSVNLIEEHYRQTLLLQAQGMHLAAPLFALDEILQPPRLLAPPPRIEPGAPIPNEDIVEATLPYLPAWPELAAVYKGGTISLSEALSGDSDIVLMGQTGMGKTVALAALASSLARREPLAGLPEDTLPFLAHVADLDLPANKDNPLSALIDLVAEKAPVLDLPRIPEFVRKAFSEGRVLLLLDGTDELTPDGLKNVVDFIKLIKRTYPKTRIVTTASTEYLDGLVSLNFIPFALAAWTHTQRSEFLQKWAALWEKYVALEAWAQAHIEHVDSLLINGWLKVACDHLTPLELTLKTWGAYAGDLRGPRPMDALETHLRRLVPANVPQQAIESLAVQTNLATEPVFDPRKAREWVKSFEPPEPIQPAKTEMEKAASKSKKKGKAPVMETPSMGLISTLTSSGLLTSHRNNRIRFCHPIFGGYLAGKALGNFKPEAVLDQPQWIGKYLAMQYLAAAGDATLVAEKLLEELDRPLSRNLLSAARWLRDAPPQASWRGPLMSKLAELLQQEGQPLGLRGQALAAFLQASGDSSIPLLFRQLLKSPLPELLQLAALGAGAAQDTKSIEPLAGLARHPSPTICRAACLALVAIGTEAAIDAVGAVLLQGEEHERRIAAEALANHPREGHSLLREAVDLKDDLMVRRAAAYGLGRIPEEWAEQILEKIQVEDSEWVVRNAAIEVLEARRNPPSHVPKRLPPATESPWLIAFAGKQGMGVTPDKPPTDLLLLALKSGTLEEKIASLNYLRILPIEGVFGVLFQAMYGGEPELREAVFRAITEMAARGVQVPDPIQFGVGY
jgi:HEAT repeat protein